MDRTLNIIPPMMIWKYRTAPAWVSSLAPQSRIMGSAKKTQAMLINVPTARVKAAAIKSTWLAPYWSFSPRRLATRADTETLVAMKMHSPMNLGWVVSPTAATASGPMELTIRESTIPARAIKKDSMTAGHAIWNAVWYPFLFPPMNFWILVF